MYDPQEITKLLVFGTNNPSPSDYSQHIRPLDATEPSITYSMRDFMDTGGGRFAYPALFNAVEKFFNSTTLSNNNNNPYDYAGILSALNLSPKDFTLGISQYGTDIGGADHADRSYIFGSTSFKLNTSTIMFHIDPNGVKTITGLEVRAFDDNFDFNTDNPLANLVNTALLGQTFDPYGLNRGAVEIRYREAGGADGVGKSYGTYTQTDFANHQALKNNVSLGAGLKDAQGIASLATNGGIGYFQNITSDQFLSYRNNGMRVIYGSPEDDNLRAINHQVPQQPLRFFMVGGEGNDRLTGYRFADEIEGNEGNDILQGELENDTLIGGKGNDNLDGGFDHDSLDGGEDNDTLDGGSGNDILNGDEGDDYLDGGTGNDTLNGGEGDDTLKGGSLLLGLGGGNDEAIYRGRKEDYNITFPNKTVKIEDMTAGRDGTDTLTGVETAVFSDQTVDLRGRDVALVIDTTGSMGDDIAAVQASAREILDSLFDNSPNSRIAVVGYNDPSTTTFLSFTDQPSIEDRKTAAINAINNISVGGGGDFPEAVNAGLLRALNGGAGAWRPEAAARRIILFGDAPPNDNELRPQVLALASNLGISTPSSARSSIATSSLASEVTLTTDPVTATDEEENTTTVPVEIFTIQIGSDPTTAEDFASLAAETGGESFNAADADQLVDELIEVIETPINNLPTVANPISHQVAIEDQDFSFTFPDNTFLDPDLEDSLTYSASLEDGSPLPGWLSFAPDTRTLSGTPTQSDVGTVNIAVIATDNEGATATETFSLLTVEEVDPVVLGEVGTVTDFNHVSQTINFSQTYNNPVVIAGPLSYNGSHTATVRIEFVTDDGFTAFVQEPSNLDGVHPFLENFSYLVLEAGTWQLADGSLVEVGGIDTDATVRESWETIDFETNFPETPAIFSSVQSYNGGDFVRTRQREDSESGFQLSLEEEEGKLSGGHLTETVGYVAIDSGSGSINGLDYTVGSTPDEVDHHWYDLDFDNNFAQEPNFLAQLASYDGPDSAGLRYQNLTDEGVQVFVEEDTSQDRETWHTTEVVNFLAIADGVLSGYGYDPITGMALVNGTDSDEILVGTEGDDSITGGLGQDVFVLGQGEDLISDFTDGADKIGLTVEFEELTFNQVSGHSVISFGADSLTLIGVDSSLLTESDFASVVI